MIPSSEDDTRLSRSQRVIEKKTPEQSSSIPEDEKSKSLD